jgi:UDP-2,3-diacylglucosamine hydrolase
MNLLPAKKIYFLSDFHLGAPNAAASLVREKKVVAFLDAIKHDAQIIFIVGDMFDFWYEYKTVIPKGYSRIFGKLAELTDSGIQIEFFVGNHDMWMNGYFEQEFNIPVHYHPKTYNFNGKSFYIGHGDGLGPADHGYKFLKKIFRNPICNWLFGQLHPTWGIGLANYFSLKSKERTGTSEAFFMGEDKEWLLIYCKEMLAKQHFNFFIFGHRHLPIDYTLSETSRYVNIGDWITNFTYASFDGNDVQLHKWLD